MFIFYTYYRSIGQILPETRQKPYDKNCTEEKNINTPAEITGLTASALKTSIELFDELQPLRFRVSREGQCDRRFRQLQKSDLPDALRTKLNLKSSTIPFAINGGTIDVVIAIRKGTRQHAEKVSMRHCHFLGDGHLALSHLNLPPQAAKRPNDLHQPKYGLPAQLAERKAH